MNNILAITCAFLLIINVTAQDSCSGTEIIDASSCKNICNDFQGAYSYYFDVSHKTKIYTSCGSSVVSGNGRISSSCSVTRIEVCNESSRSIKVTFSFIKLSNTLSNETQSDLTVEEKEQLKVINDIDDFFKLEEEKYYEEKRKGNIYYMKFPKKDDYAKRRIDWKKCINIPSLTSQLCLEISYIIKVGVTVTYGSDIIFRADYSDNTFRACMGEGLLQAFFRMITSLFSIYGYLVRLVLWLFSYLPFTFFNVCFILSNVIINGSKVTGEGAVELKIICWRGSCAVDHRGEYGKFEFGWKKNATLNFPTTQLVEIPKNETKEKEIEIVGVGVHLYNDRNSCMDDNYHQTIIYQKCTRLPGNKGMKIECNSDKSSVRISHDCDSGCGACKNATIFETNKCIHFMGSRATIRCSGTVRFNLKEESYLSSTCSEQSYGFTRYFRSSACVYHDESSKFTCNNQFAIENRFLNSFTCHPDATKAITKIPINRCLPSMRRGERYRIFKC